MTAYEYQAKLYQARSQLLAIKSERAAFNLKRALRRFVILLETSKFNPAQPRTPAGQPGGGQWAGSDGQEQEPQIILAGSPPGRSGYPIDLFEEKALGGHTIERHIAKPEEFLKARILSSRKNIAGIVTFGEARAGSFTSLEAPSKLINSTLSQNSEKLEAFVEGRFPSVLPFILLFGEFDSPTGYEAYARNPRSQPVMRPTKGVTVLIRRTDRSEKGYYVETAWPMNED